MNNLNNFHTVKTDLALNDFPVRNEDDNYEFNQGQKAILHQEKYYQISKYGLEIEQAIAREKATRNDILAFQMPSDSLAREGDKVKEDYTAEIEEEKDCLKLLKADRKQYVEDVMDRGYIPEDSNIVPEQPKQPEPKPKPRSINWKAGLSFILMWVTGEIFMTYVSYASLRYEKAVENIIARSVAFAVVLFLIHYVAHLNKTHRKIVYIFFLVFSFFMVFTMLFAPLILGQLYPVTDAPSIADQWTINPGNAVTTALPQTGYPFWVELYRKYDMMPGMLVFLFYIIMQSLLRIKKPADKPVEPQQPQEKIDPVQDEITKRISYHDYQIRQSEARLSELKRLQHQALHPNTDGLYNILKKLQEKQQELLTIEQQKDTLKNKLQLLLKNVQTELSQYQLEFKAALNNDPVKSSFVNPDWANENDILNYYKIKLA